MGVPRGPRRTSRDIMSPTCSPLQLACDHVPTTQIIALGKVDLFLMVLMGDKHTTPDPPFPTQIRAASSGNFHLCPTAQCLSSSKSPALGVQCEHLHPLHNHTMGLCTLRVCLRSRSEVPELADRMRPACVLSEREEGSDRVSWICTFSKFL